jgi:SSS family transporter
VAATTQYAIILVFYFAGMLGLGLWFQRRQKNVTDYFLARGKLGSGAIGFSYSATQMSGSSYMGAVGTERMYGYNFSPAAVSSAAAPWFTYVLIGDRLRRVAAKIRCNTLVDVLQARYGGRATATSATLIMLVAFAPLVAAQLKAAANAFEVMLGIPYLVALGAFGLIVIIYTVTGGMHAVAWTDLIQGTIMIVGFAVLAPTAVGAAGGFADMHSRYAELQPGSIRFIGTMPAIWVVSSFLVWGFFQIGGAPAAVTRFLIPEEDRTLKMAMVYSIGFSSFIYITGTLIAIASGVLLPALERPDLALPTLVTALLPPVAGGIIVAAVLGATMSTIDSVLLLAGSLVVENLWLPARGRDVGEAEALRVARFATLALGLAALVTAINPPAAIYWIVTMAFSLMASAFTFPLLLGLWWRRATREGALAGMLGGAVTAVAWYVAGYVVHGTLEDFIGGIWPALLGPTVSLLLMVAVSHATPAPPAEVVELFFGGEAERHRDTEK